MRWRTKSLREKQLKRFNDKVNRVERWENYETH